MLDAASELIAAVQNTPGRPASMSEINNLLIVSGALRRQLRKRYDSDSLDNLGDQIVDQAYLNEIARVIRSWPTSGEWIRPLAFYGTAHRLRMELAARDLVERPDAMPEGRFPCLLDLRIPVVIRKNERQLAYASVGWRKLMLNASPNLVINAHMPVGVFSPEHELPRLQEERYRMLMGERLVDRSYESSIPGIPRMTIYSSSAIYDDNGVLVGEMKVGDDASKAQVHTTLVKVRQRELAISLEMR